MQMQKVSQLATGAQKVSKCNRMFTKYTSASHDCRMEHQLCDLTLYRKWVSM